jgi:folate-binding protein YgfZ
MTVPDPVTVAPVEDVPESYRAMHDAAVLIDCSDRSRLALEGAKAAEVMSGLVTNDVTKLAPGEGQYAAALTPKGKIIADTRIFRTDDGVLADVSPAAAEGWWAMIRKYINPRLAKYRDVSGETADLSVFGPRAEAVIALAAEIPGESLGLDGPYRHRKLTIAGARAIVARIPDAGVMGFAIICPSEAKASVAQLLINRGARRALPEVLDVARVEAGRPAWGRDIDDTTLTQEANLDELQAISYEKGCYTGQETVARVHFRGHVNRFLRGLVLERDDVPSGAALWSSDKQVGDIRSVVISPRLGPIALGMVRREVPAGERLEIRMDGRTANATVVQLPFA